MGVKIATATVTEDWGGHSTIFSLRRGTQNPFAHALHLFVVGHHVKNQKATSALKQIVSWWSSRTFFFFSSLVLLLPLVQILGIHCCTDFRRSAVIDYCGWLMCTPWNWRLCPRVSGSGRRTRSSSTIICGWRSTAIIPPSRSYLRSTSVNGSRGICLVYFSYSIFFLIQQPFPILEFL